MFGARAEDLKALLLGAPLQNVDVDIAHAPAFHLELGRLVEIDRIRADERGPVIVDDVFLPRAANFKSRS